MLRDLIKNFLIELKMKGCSEYTINTYKHNLNKFVFFVETHNLDFRELTSSQVKLFRNQMVEQGLKPGTINTALSILKSFYDFLVEEMEVKGNPVITRRLRIKEGQSLPKFMTSGELRVFNDWLTTIPEHVALGFRIMLATGMRVSEVSSITARDVIKLDNGGYVIRVRHGKGDKERYVPIMDSEVAGDLLRFKENRPGDSPLLGLQSKDFNRWAEKCRQETGLKFHPHRCRHTVGTQLLQKGISIDKVQVILGHADISTTRRYARTAPEAVLELAAKANKEKRK